MKHSSITPHLRQLDGLIYENCVDIKNAKKTPYVTTHYGHHKCAIILRKQQLHSDLADFLHAACFAPVKSTFLKAIKLGFFKTWPGLSERLITKHLHPSPATSKGHLCQTRQHLQSTKHNNTHVGDIKHNVESLKKVQALHPKQTKLNHDTLLMDQDSFPTSDIPNERSNNVLYTIFDSSPTELSYIDLTGRFPYKSARGNQYILVAYHHDANAILAQPLKNREAATITARWPCFYKRD